MKGDESDEDDNYGEVELRPYDHTCLVCKKECSSLEELGSHTCLDPLLKKHFRCSVCYKTFPTYERIQVRLRPIST